MSDEPIDFKAAFKQKLLETAKEMKEVQIREGQIIGRDHISDEDIAARIEILVSLYRHDDRSDPINRIKYEREKQKLHFLTGINLTAIDAQVKQLVKESNPPRIPSLGESIDHLIRIAKANAKLWRSPLDVGHASFDSEGHTEHCRISDRQFGDFIVGKFLENMKNLLIAFGAEPNEDALDSRMFYPRRKDVTWPAPGLVDTRLS